MEFVFKTTYDQKAMTIMAKVLRKTVRKKHSRRSHILGWIVTVLALLLALPLGEKEFILDFRTVITWLAIILIILALLFEDQMNGYLARKRMLPGTTYALCKFTEEGYISETKAGKTEWQYKNIELIAETKEYFVFVFGKNHAQVYDKSQLTGGTVESFRSFIKEKTEKYIHTIR